MWGQQNHGEGAMPDHGQPLTKWGTCFGLNRSALDDEAEDLDEEFGDAALGISRSDQRSWQGRSAAAAADNESFCVVVGARVPLRQQSPHRRRNRSPGRYHASPGRSCGGDGRYLSPGRYHDIPHGDISPGGHDCLTGQHPQGLSRLEDTDGRRTNPDRPSDISNSGGSDHRHKQSSRTERNVRGGGGEGPGRGEGSADRLGDAAGRSLVPYRGVGPRRAEHPTTSTSIPRPVANHSSPGRHRDAAGRDTNRSAARDETRYASSSRGLDAGVRQSGGGWSRHRDRSASGSRVPGSGSRLHRGPDCAGEHHASSRTRSLHHHGQGWASPAWQLDRSGPSSRSDDGQRGVCVTEPGQPSSSSSYEKLEQEWWALYTSQGDVHSVGLRPTSSSSSQRSLSSSSISSEAGCRTSSERFHLDSSIARSKLRVRCGSDSGSQASFISGSGSGEVYTGKESEAVPPLFCPSGQAGVSSSSSSSCCVVTGQGGSGSLRGDTPADSGGGGLPLVSSLRRRSKSESDKLDEDEVPKSRPSKSVHFSIFPYVHQIPARQKTSSMGSSRGISSLVTPERSGRTRSRIGVSQSQPGSRSTSPSSRGSYLTHTQPGRDPMTPKGKRKSGIPRSQGASREASPNRHTYGRERRLSGSKVHPGTGLMSQRVLRPGSDVEDALHDALSRPQRKRYEVYDSDDAASETSSVCSERSYTSYSGRTSEDMSEIIAFLGSGSHTERKDGLISLQHLLRSSRYLSRMELKKVTEVFTRMFHDPHSKVFSIFLDTLSELCLVHGRDLTDWLYVLLTRLLNKTGTDMLGSVHAKLLRTLDTVRDTFPCDSQFNTITKFIIDQTQSPNLKVKISMLNFLHGLVMVMEPSDFVNTMDTRLAVSRIINWTMEPRNVDVRKSAQLVLIGLFNLNPPEFSLMLAALPKAFQDGATKILHSHMRSASECNSDVLSPRNATSPVGQQRSRPPSRQSVGQPEECETENMNPEDIYNSIKKTSADIQNLSLGTKLDGYDDIKKKREFASQDSGIQELRNDSPDGVESRRGNLHMYNPQHYQEETGLNGFGKSLLAQDSDTASYEKEPTMADVLRELSNHNERVRERRKMLDMLLKWVRNNSISEEQWDEHFKSILLILIETFNDTDKTMRMDALIVFRSILKRQAARFKDYAELTILKICEAHKDPSKDPGELQVQRAAEECALVIPTAISPEQALPILNNIIHTAKFPIHWAAIKMQVEVVKLVSTEVLERSLPSTVPGLIMGYDDSDSRVRKAAVFCLVNIYLQVGESLRPYLANLNSSKTKLLNLYIKRAQEDSRSGIMSPAASDT